LGIIHLVGCAVRVNQLRRFSFALETPRRTYFFSAESADEQRDWMLLISQSITTAVDLPDGVEVRVQRTEQHHHQQPEQPEQQLCLVIDTDAVILLD
jgi:hypothetical protein